MLSILLMIILVIFLLGFFIYFLNIIYDDIKFTIKDIKISKRRYWKILWSGIKHLIFDIVMFIILLAIVLWIVWLVLSFIFMSHIHFLQHILQHK